MPDMGARPRPCLGAGGQRCPRLTRDSSGRCDDCRRANYRERDLSRPSASQRGYGRDWRKLREVILARDGRTCRHCGSPAEQVDHIRPKARGGTDDPNNLVASCTRCNARRGGQLRAAHPVDLPPPRDAPMRSVIDDCPF